MYRINKEVLSACTFTNGFQISLHKKYESKEENMARMLRAPWRHFQYFINVYARSTQKGLKCRMQKFSLHAISFAMIKKTGQDVFASRLTEQILHAIMALVQHYDDRNWVVNGCKS